VAITNDRKEFPLNEKYIMVFLKRKFIKYIEIVGAGTEVLGSQKN
jgi:hypothetical protein